MDRKLSAEICNGLTQTRSRREVLGTAAKGALGGLGLSALAFSRNGADAVGCLRIRPNLHGLDPAGPELTAYAQGIQQMKLLAELDPISWLYQANIHGTFTLPAEPIWNTCEHGTLQFWPWHRLYLVMFERIVRQASGYEPFALPFWDYSDPNQRVLPAPFRDPASPLYVGDRNPSVNAGTPPPPAMDSIFDHCPSFAETNFDFASFGLEGTPHGQVHVWVEGWMGFFETAGQDPIFWLHHSNIDRLWESWLAQGGGRANPVDPGWLNAPNSFFDEAGAPVTMTTAEILDTAELCYAYEYLATCGPSPFEAVPTLETRGTPEAIGESVTEGDIQLGPEAVVVQIDLTVDDALLVDRAIVLNLEGVQGEGVLMVTFEIYVNLPPDLEPDHRSIYYVGNINLFGLQPTGREPSIHNEHIADQRFNLGKNIAALRANEEWTGELEITFVPLVLGTPEVVAEATAAAVQEGPWVTIDRIEVTAE